MKKILILSSLALVLTACSNDTGSKSKSVTSQTTTTTSQTPTSSSESKVTTQSTTQPITTEKVAENTTVKSVSAESVLEKEVNRILSNAKTYNFDGIENTNGHAYAVHNTPSGKYLLLARKGWIAGIKYIKIFHYNEVSQKFEDLNVVLQEGVASGGGFRGSLRYYGNNPAKLEYATWSAGSGEGEVKTLYLTSAGLSEEIIYEGLITDYKSSQNILEIIWKNI